MPIYNDARFIRQALRSLLNQDWPSIEIVVSDNASTDGTEAIVREYPVRYLRQPDHVSAAENFARAFRETNGSHFMWAAGHDLWSPNYVTECLRWLLEYPGRVLAFPETRLIDADGREQGIMPATPNDLSDVSALARYRRLVWEMENGNMIYGLIRRDALERTSLGKAVTGADHLILAELALQGPFQRAYGAIFYRRLDDDSDVERPLRRARDMGLRAPDYRALRDEHLRAVAGLSVVDRLRARRATRLAFRARFGVT